jgi:hypothetical protein
MRSGHPSAERLKRALFKHRLIQRFPKPEIKLSTALVRCYRRHVSAAAVTEDRIKSELEISGFRHLEEILRCLLGYLWKNRDSTVSEYAIAVEALGRNPDFESKFDATVRVQISRLRRFLTKYYEAEGRQSTIRLIIPLGTHQIQIIEVIPESDPASEAGTYLERSPEYRSSSADANLFAPLPPTQIAPPEPHRSVFSILAPTLVPVLACIIVVLVSCLGWILWASAHPSGRSILSSKQELPLFWKKFLDNGKSTRIVLPTPIFFAWQPNGQDNTLLARDITVNESAKLDSSAQIVDIEKRLGKPNIWQNYTVASDTFASLRLARFLDSFGVQTSFSSSAESPHEITDHENIVAFGTTSSLAAYQSDLDRLNFKLGPHERYVIDKRLPAGSAGQFPVLVESASRMVMPGLVAILPRDASGTRILLVQGAQTTALISYLTSEEGMREITEAQAKRGDSQFFEAVVLSEVNAGNPIQSRLVAFRPFVIQSTQPGQLNVASLPSKPAQQRRSW